MQLDLAAPDDTGEALRLVAQAALGDQHGRAVAGRVSLGVELERGDRRRLEQARADAGEDQREGQDRGDRGQHGDGGGGPEAAELTELALLPVGLPVDEDRVEFAVAREAVEGREPLGPAVNGLEAVVVALAVRTKGEVRVIQAGELGVRPRLDHALAVVTKFVAAVVNRPLAGRELARHLRPPSPAPAGTCARA